LVHIYKNLFHKHDKVVWLHVEKYSLGDYIYLQENVYKEELILDENHEESRRHPLSYIQPHHKEDKDLSTNIGKE